MIRILLAEDQAMMRGALAVLLGLEDDLEVVAQVATGDRIVWPCSTSSCPGSAGSRPRVS